MYLGSHLEWCDCTRARVGEEYIDVTMLLFHDGIEPVQIFQARHVAHDRRNVSLDEGCRLLQLFLLSPSDHDVRTFFHEALGCGQANTARSTRDDYNFVLKLAHVSPFGRMCSIQYGRVLWRWTRTPPLLNTTLLKSLSKWCQNARR